MGGQESIRLVFAIGGIISDATVKFNQIFFYIFQNNPLVTYLSTDMHIFRQAFSEMENMSIPGMEIFQPILASVSDTLVELNPPNFF